FCPPAAFFLTHRRAAVQRPEVRIRATPDLILAETLAGDSPARDLWILVRRGPRTVASPVPGLTSAHAPSGFFGKWRALFRYYRVRRPVRVRVFAEPEGGREAQVGGSNGAGNRACGNPADREAGMEHG